MEKEKSHAQKLKELKKLLIKVVSYNFWRYHEEDCLSLFGYEPTKIVVYYLTRPKLTGNQLLAFVELVEYLKEYFPRILSSAYDEASDIIAEENKGNCDWYDHMNEYAQVYLKEMVEEKCN